MKFSAAILAGGKSSRMGRDKAFLEIGGQTLLAHQIELVQAAGATEIFISGRADTDYSNFGLPVLQDEFPDIGPLGGIHAALGAAQYPLVLILAVDLPAMTSRFLNSLTMASASECGVIPQVGGRVEPLAAIYPRAASDIVSRMLKDGNLTVRQFGDACVKAGLTVYNDVPAELGHLFKNMNVPADVPRLV